MNKLPRVPLTHSRRLLWCAAALFAAAMLHHPYALEGQTQTQALATGHQGVAFETSDNCLACHNGMATPAGEDVSIGVQWRASMMANSARDPYWQAAVRREVIDHPTKKAAIEDECSLCHMPMATTTARAAERHGEVFRLLPSSPGDAAEHRMAADGVSCTVCHQIGTERLGTPASFNGGFVVNTAPAGQRRMLGGYDVDEGRMALMRSATDVQPAKAEHMRSSELCATCHTLFTEAFDAAGTVVGSLPEQVPYLEWRHSALAGERSCQSCHMPSVESTPIASVLGEPRERMSRHTFLGGNVFMLRMLNRFRMELGVTAPAQDLDAAARATLRQLETATATIDIARAELVAGRLEADVLVRNVTGHKLPTGYPSRRTWIHFTVRDRDGRTVFESGGVTAQGAIVGNDNDADGARFEPHHERVRDAGDVQIYEAIMGDPRGGVTTGLLQATQYLKDNRLLPRGFDKATASPDIAVRGAAAQDSDFTADGDRVRYDVPLAGAAGPFRIDAELRYQPIAFRWADNLRRYDAAEPRRFVSYFDAMAASSSTVLVRANADVK